MTGFSAVPGLAVPGRTEPANPGTVIVSGADLSTGADAGIIGLPGSDPGTGTGLAAIGIAGADTGTGADTAVITVAGTDSGAGADAGTAVALQPAGLRAGLLAGTASNLNSYAGSAS